MARVAQQCAVCVVMLVLLFAGLAKLVDAPHFARSLETWHFVPHRAIATLALLVPLLEVTVAGLWLIRCRPHAAQVAAAALLGAFTTAYAAHVWLYEPPKCACLGEFRSQQRERSEAPAVLARNLLLLGILGIGTVRLPLRDRSDRVRLPSSAPPGFTIIEMLIVIAIIGILLTLSLPSLARVRDGARTVASLGQLRSHSQIFSLYTTDWQDVYPYLTDPDATYTVLSGGDRRALVPYFGVHTLWILGMADHYYGENPAHPSFFPPGRELRNPPYKYSLSFLAAPDYWDWETRTGRQQWRPVRVDEVTFPTKKGLLVSWANAEVPDVGGKGPGLSFRAPGLRLETAFCDASAQLVPYSSFLAPVPDGTGPFAQPPGSFGDPVLHTLDGARGRDIP